MVSDDLKRRIREANNIVDVITAAVGKLVRAGRNLKACCPFHNEKTPSFNVSADGQYFKCFGCGKSGDVFTFVQLYERVEFFDALKILADRAGIQVESDPKAQEQYKKETDWKSYLYRLNDVACRFYREQLFSNAGKAAREYIKKRGLTDEICEQFRLGYAPPGGSPLLERLQSQGAPMKAILLSGLASQRDNGSVHDFFFDRLMFPITDIQGRVIAFGGRILGEGEPKYLNTRETKLFSKTHTVYALDHAREEIISTRTAMLVEGYTDVMMCHQFGITNVVACLGTAITEEHVRQLRRVADNLLMLTDSDAAGAKASERSLAILLKEDMPSRIARLPGNDKDPCDFLLAQGKEPFLKAIEQSMDLFDYKFERVSLTCDLRTPAGLKKAADELMSLVSIIPDTLLKNRYRYEVLKRLNIDERDLKYEVQTQRNVSSRDTTDPKDTIDSTLPPEPENRLAATEREFLKFLFHQPAFLGQASELVNMAALTGTPERLIGTALLNAMSEGKLPPEPAAMETGPASQVAREVLAKLAENPSGSGGSAAPSGAVPLCIALAESRPAGKTLESRQQLEMLFQRIQYRTLYAKYSEVLRKRTHAAIHQDAEGQARADQELDQIRDAMKPFKLNKQLDLRH